MSKSTIFLLFKRKDTMTASHSLRCASISDARIRRGVVREIHNRTMRYGGETLSIGEQIKALRKDWQELPYDKINEKLMGGSLETVLDGVLAD